MPLRSLEATLAHNGHGHLAFALPHRHFPFAFSPSGSVSQSFFRMIFNRRARDWTELFVRFSWCPISPELAPASANFRRLSSSACVHGREAWRAGSFILLSPSARARPGGGWLARSDQSSNHPPFVTSHRRPLAKFSRILSKRLLLSRRCCHS